MNLTVESFSRRRSRAGFSLIEMIGVLAIIAILAVVIVPKVFSTITSSRITTAIGSVTSMKSAVAEFMTKYGTLPPISGANRFDDILAQEGILEGRFAVKIGTQAPNPGVPAAGTWTRNPATGLWTNAGAANQAAQTKLISIARPAAPPVAPVGNFYLLDGVTPIPTGSMVVSAMIVGVPAAEARDLSIRIDGEALSLTVANAALADTMGKVTYTAGAGNRTVYVYVAHQ